MLPGPLGFLTYCCKGIAVTLRGWELAHCDLSEIFHFKALRLLVLKGKPKILQEP